METIKTIIGKVMCCFAAVMCCAAGLGCADATPKAAKEAVMKKYPVVENVGDFRFIVKDKNGFIHYVEVMDTFNSNITKDFIVLQ